MKAFTSRVAVLLYRRRQRTHLDGARTVSASSRARGFTGTDLTHWFAGPASMNVTKSIRQPAGTVSITLPERQAIDGGWLYDAIEPGDLLEIRFSKKPVAGLPPVYMRAIVTGVERELSVAGGAPRHMVSIRAADFGHVLEVLRVYWRVDLNYANNLHDTYRGFANFLREAPTAMSGPDFLAALASSTLNPSLASMAGVIGNFPSGFTVDCSVVDCVDPNVVGQFRDGSMGQLVRQVLDVGIWNEMFVESVGAEERLVARPAPWRTPSGALCLPGASAPARATLDLYSDIETMRVGRSDDGVANYFLVQSPALEMNDPLAFARENGVPLPDGDPNADPLVFGLRPLEGSVSTQPPSGPLATGTTPAAVSSEAVRYVEWLRAKRDAMVAANRDAVAFETGTIVCTDPTIRAGSEVVITGGMGGGMAYYVPQVSVRYDESGLVTTLSVERGSGWIEGQKSSVNPASLIHLSRNLRGR